MLTDHEEEELQENQHNLHIAQKPQNECNYMFVLLLFVMLVGSMMVIGEIFSTVNEDTQNGKFYRQELLSYELIDFWKRSAQEMIEEQNIKDDQLISNDDHKISREQMGHNAWELLHMMTGSFPDQIPDALVKKFNVFLISFGQFYPCKLCANHFMGHLQRKGPFQGTTKKQLMTYLCQLHNMVNEALSKPLHDCTDVVEEWNNCGCSAEL